MASRFFHIIVFLTLMIFLGSCKKERTIDFSGKVYDPVSGNSIAGVKLELIEQQGPSLTDPLQSDSDPVVELITTSNGSFHFNYVGKSRYDYYVLVTYDSEVNRMIGWQNGGDEIKEVELEEIQDNLEIVPKGRYRYDIKNINCFDETDTMHRELVRLS